MSLKERLIIRRVRQEIKDERDKSCLPTRPQVCKHKRQADSDSGDGKSGRTTNKGQ